MKNFRKTRIIGTIGPASESEEMFTKLVEAGLNVARINFSHGGYKENEEKINMIKRVREKLGKPVALCLDNKGPEIRTGKMESGNEKVLIEEGQEFTFVADEIVGDKTKACLSYKEMYKEVKPGDSILVDDGAVQFKIKEVRGTDIVCEAMNTARLGQRKTVNVPGVSLELPALSEKDITDIKDGIKAGFDYIFASFVRRADDVNQIRELLLANGGERVGIIAKIESTEGIENFDEILEVADGIMVARGDMGVEIPFEQVPVVQKQMIRKCNLVGKPVITATQMLESMQENPRPTRAEVSDVANAVYDLTGAIMLSGECAMGKYPVECVETMDKIANAIESELKYWKRFDARGNTFENTNLKANIAYSAADTAKDIEADAIVAYTRTIESARLLSGLKPKVPIIAITDDEKTFYKLGLISGTYPVLVEGEKNIDSTIEKGIDKMIEEGILAKGDMIVVSGGNKILPHMQDSQVIGGIAIL